MDVACIYSGGCGKYMQWNTTPAIKKNEILPSAAAWMDLEGIMQSEISQTEKDIYYVLPLVCRIWTWNKQVNITKQTHRYTEETQVYQWEVGKRRGKIRLGD